MLQRYRDTSKCCRDIAIRANVTEISRYEQMLQRYRDTSKCYRDIAIRANVTDIAIRANVTEISRYEQTLQRYRDMSKCSFGSCGEVRGTWILIEHSTVFPTYMPNDYPVYFLIIGI